MNKFELNTNKMVNFYYMVYDTYSYPEKYLGNGACDVAIDFDFNSIENHFDEIENTIKKIKHYKESTIILVQFWTLKLN